MHGSIYGDLLRAWAQPRRNLRSWSPRPPHRTLLLLGIKLLHCEASRRFPGRRDGYRNRTASARAFELLPYRTWLPSVQMPRKRR